MDESDSTLLAHACELLAVVKRKGLFNAAVIIESEGQDYELALTKHRKFVPAKPGETRADREVHQGCPWCHLQPKVSPPGCLVREAWCINEGCVGHQHVVPLQLWDQRLFPFSDRDIALREAVQLLAQYAKDLNMQDGGQRMELPIVPLWIAWLRATGKLPMAKLKIPGKRQRRDKGMRGFVGACRRMQTD